MKYCTKCGKELVDEAVVCPNCGCLVQGSTGFSKKIEVKKDRDAKIVKEDTNDMKKFHIFNFISNILYSVYFCFALLLLPTLWIKVYEGGGYHSAILSFDDGITIPLFIVSIFNFILTLITLILYLSNVKEKTLENVLKYISRLIAAALLLIPAILIASAAW